MYYLFLTYAILINHGKVSVDIYIIYLSCYLSGCLAMFVLYKYYIDMKLEKRSYSLEKKSKSPKQEHDDKSKKVGDSSTNKPKKAGGMSFFTKADSKDDRYSFLTRFFMMRLCSISFKLNF